MFCSGCGEKLDRNSNFCASCGNPLSGVKDSKSTKNKRGKGSPRRHFFIILGSVVLTGLLVALNFQSINNLVSPSEFKTLSGTFTVNSEVSDAESAQECLNAFTKAIPGECGNIYVEGLICQGGGSFNDISDGGVVEVKDSLGEIMAIGSLRTGRLDKENFNLVGNSILISCQIPFSVTNVKVIDDNYIVSFGKRGSRTYTKTELDAANWKLDFSIG
jgi:hypothetical protein